MGIPKHLDKLPNDTKSDFPSLIYHISDKTCSRLNLLFVVQLSSQFGSVILRGRSCNSTRTVSTISVITWVADHLEVLGFAHGRRVCIGLVECAHHAHAFDRLLLDPVDLLGAPVASRIVGTISMQCGTARGCHRHGDVAGPSYRAGPASSHRNATRSV
jgi:hypothetical protein